MQNSLKLKFWNHLPLKDVIYISLGICAFLVLSVTTLQRFLPPEVPLSYGEAVGENQLVGSWGLLFAPAFAFTILLINTFIASKISDEFTQKTLIVSALFISILAFITVIKIVFLVGFF